MSHSFEPHVGYGYLCAICGDAESRHDPKPLTPTTPSLTRDDHPFEPCVEAICPSGSKVHCHRPACGQPKSAHGPKPVSRDDAQTKEQLEEARKIVSGFAEHECASYIEAGCPTCDSRAISLAKILAKVRAEASR